MSSATNGISQFISSHGTSAHELLWSVGMHEADTRKEHEILDLGAYCQLLEAASCKTRNDNFGLHYGRDFTPDRLGLIGEIAVSSPTLADALGNLVKYFPYHQQNTLVALQRRGEFWHLEYRILDGLILQRRQDAELTMGMYLNIVRRVVNANWSPDEVHFEHPRPEKWREHETVFNAPVYFNMKTNALVFREKSINRPACGWENGRMQALCDALMQLTGGTGTLGLNRRVVGEIRAQLPSGYPHIEDVAEALKMTRWTLQRRLAAEGQVFSTLVEETRRRLALLYLGQTHLTINDIASILGYSELSAFSRACVRWFDAAPSKMRAASLAVVAAGRLAPQLN
ncbi:AraC family transcriptional regulator [Rhizobium sp. S152]|uniref:AraC-like transcriptional regulator QhpR n=1 Tax=Rhizobium sp. S152 TaxID=3055038 RepID=UPI0025A93BDC|nr:AraC family transcriptional regulator [Rhizobium sp. S152]MDM9625007.1 AraC family transcriptional regulator [Rhizobium sp. S152]